MNRMKTLRLHALWAALFSWSLISLAQAADAPAGQEALPAAAAVAANARCPVCGMYPARYPKWMVQLIYRDQTQKVFDSPADLLRFMQQMEKYDRKHAKADVAVIYLSDHQKGGWINARTSYLVMGSKVRGPMNQPDLPAFPSRELAEQFTLTYGGHVHAWDEIQGEVLDALLHGQDMPHADHHHH